MKAGDIVHLNWSPQSGSEMKYEHYGVVMTVERFNESFPRVAVAPLTSSYNEKFRPVREKIKCSHVSRFHGYICIDHLRFIDPRSRGLNMSGYRVTSSCLSNCRNIMKKVLGT